MIQKKVVCLLLAILMLLSLSACSTAQNALPTVPFSDADWLWSLDELQKHLGVPESSYLSVYGGETCTYPFSYMGRDGIIKYMFSESGKLASIAWAYITQDADDLAALYTAVDEDEISRHGKSSFSSQNHTIYGDVWYLPACDILISTIFGNESCGLQYAYILHEFSKH